MKKYVVLCLIAITTLAYGAISSTPIGLAPAANPPSLNLVENGKTYTSIAKYMAQFVKYPDGTDSYGLIGTVVAEFIVNPDGTITNIKVINSLSSASDQEVIRVLKKTSGNWIPANSNNKVVSMKREVSVAFKPNVNYDLNAIAIKNRTKAKDEIVEDKDFKKAIKYYNKSIQFMPYEQSFFAERGMCKYELGDVSGAKADWDRIKSMKKYDPAKFNFKASHVDPALQSVSAYAALKQHLGN